MNIRLKFINATISWIVILVLIAGCQKEEKYESVENPYHVAYNYELFTIYLTKDYKFLEVKHYITNGNFTDTVFDYSLFYNYTSNQVEIIKKDKYNQVFSIRAYNKLLLADNCRDSFFYGNNYIDHLNFRMFKYDKHGFLINERTQYLTSGSNSEEKNYTILNGNTNHVYDGYYDSTYYEFYDTENKIDIFSFLGDFQGKKDTNLRKSLVKADLSYSKDITTYNYELDLNGFVTKRTEFRVQTSNPYFYNYNYTSIVRSETQTVFKYIF